MNWILAFFSYWIIFWIESWKFSFELKIELNHFWQFSFESKIELNHFRAKFNHWLNRQIVPPRAIRDESLFLFYVVAWGEIEKLKIKFSWSSEKKWPQFSREFSRSRYLAGLCQQSYGTQSKHGYNTTKPCQLRADATIPHIWDFCRKFAGHLGQIFRFWWLLPLQDCRISKAKKSGVRCI